MQREENMQKKPTQIHRSTTFITILALLQGKRANVFGCYSNRMYVIYSDLFPKIHILVLVRCIDGDPSLALPSHWHLRIGGSPAPQGPCREAAPRKTARARRGGTTAPREDGKHGAGDAATRRAKKTEITIVSSVCIYLSIYLCMYVCMYAWAHSLLFERRQPSWTHVT